MAGPRLPLLACILVGMVACQGKPLPSNRSVDSDFEGTPGSSGGGVGPPAPVRSLKIKINEVVLENPGTLSDERGEHPPWVELFNPTEDHVDLSGVPLSDDLGLAKKWAFPESSASIIAPHGYLVVYCDGDPRGLGGLHASFRLVPGSLTIILNKGADIFFGDGGSLSPGESLGRYPDGDSRVSTLSRSTPGQPNSEPVVALPVTFVRGDANEDSRVNVSDVTTVLLVLFGSRPAPACQDRLDADDSGKVDLGDALRISNTLFQRGAPLAPPFPGAGSDPTADDLPCRAE